VAERSGVFPRTEGASRISAICRTTAAHSRSERFDKLPPGRAGGHQNRMIVS